ncbi:MAG: hypothetical protein ACE5JS_10540 [Nitrospinota bacterium]
MRGSWRLAAGFLGLFYILLGLFAGPALGVGLQVTAPNFQIFDEAEEEEKDFYRFVGNNVVLLWFWDWGQGCPV